MVPPRPGIAGMADFFAGAAPCFRVDVWLTDTPGVALGPGILV